MIVSGVPSTKIRTARKTLTFTGAANLGAVDTNATIFTITGEVYIHAIIPVCSTDLTGATSTVQLGTTQQLTRFIGVTTATDIDAGEFWVSTTPTVGAIDLPDALQSVVISEDEILVRSVTAGTASGVLEFTVYWEPVSTDGTLV